MKDLERRLRQRSRKREPISNSTPVAVSSEIVRYLDERKQQTRRPFNRANKITHINIGMSVTRINYII